MVIIIINAVRASLGTCRIILNCATSICTVSTQIHQVFLLLAEARTLPEQGPMCSNCLLDLESVLEVLPRCGNGEAAVIEDEEPVKLGGLVTCELATQEGGMRISCASYCTVVILRFRILWTLAIRSQCRAQNPNGCSSFAWCSSSVPSVPAASWLGGRVAMGFGTPWPVSEPHGRFNCSSLTHGYSK